MSETLEKCPYPGCKTDEGPVLNVKKRASVTEWYVICPNCGARGPTFHVKREAVKKWNAIAKKFLK